jgi:hypothetical protein
MFCIDCIQQYVETQVFANGNLGIDKKTKQPATEILCLSGEGGGCSSGFEDKFLENVLPTKTWEKYCELQHHAIIKQAGLGESMATCPKCGFRALIPDEQMIFECPAKDCMFASCKKCGKEPHIPLRCDEVVQKKRQDEGRLKIEEALSEAKMRTCPGCKQKFIKSDGCNKMSCPCGLKICYVCRAPLDKKNPYSHFCQTAHCTHESCGKCKLHSNDEEDDQQAMREAGITAAERYKEEIRKEGGRDTSTGEVNFDVDQMLHDPARPARSSTRQQQLQAMRHQARADALAALNANIAPRHGQQDPGRMAAQYREQLERQAQHFRDQAEQLRAQTDRMMVQAQQRVQQAVAQAEQRRQEAERRAQQMAVQAQQQAEQRRQEAERRAQQMAVQVQQQAEQLRQEAERRAQQMAVQAQQQAEQRRQEAERRAQQMAVQAQQQAEQLRQEAERRAQQMAVQAQQQAEQRRQEAERRAQQMAVQTQQRAQHQRRDELRQQGQQAEQARAQVTLQNWQQAQQHSTARGQEFWQGRQP